VIARRSADVAADAEPGSSGVIDEEAGMGNGMVGSRPSGPARRGVGATPKKDRIMRAIAGRLAGATFPDGAGLAAEVGLPATEIDTFIGVCAGDGLLTLDWATRPPLVCALTPKGAAYLRGAAAGGPG
jgi:hypothetical protein